MHAYSWNLMWNSVACCWVWILNFLLRKYVCVPFYKRWLLFSIRQICETHANRKTGKFSLHLYSKQLSTFSFIAPFLCEFISPFRFILLSRLSQPTAKLLLFDSTACYRCLNHTPATVLLCACVIYYMCVIIGVHRLNNRRADEIEIIKHIVNNFWIVVKSRGEMCKS